MSESVDVSVKKDVKKPTLPTSASNFPMPKLSSPYRSDNQPFTTYIPYQPLHREQHIQQSQSQQRHQHQPEQHEAQPPSAAEAQERKHDQADTQTLPPQPHRALPPPQQQQQQQQQLLQQQLQQARPPASSVIIFKQDKPKRAISKKAGKPFVCKHPGCTWAFARHSDLTRHTKSHAPPQYVCPYWRNDPTCHKKDGSFNRLDVLKRHLRLIHYVKDKQPMGQLSPGDDPGWCRSCQRMFPNSKAFVEHCSDCAKNTTPTEWIEIKKEGGSTNPNQATFRVNLEQVKKTKST